jgi:feruloyl esterase
LPEGTNEWDWHTLNFDADIALADKRGAAQIDAIATDLTPFVSLGHKLMLFHGWADPNVAPRNTVNYYGRVMKATVAPGAVDSIRLFMAPGMGHCGGGEGPNNFDRVTEMAQWIRTGKAPDQMIASHATDGKVDRTRPLCAFPKVAKYSGSGSIDEAANFTCVMPTAK